MRLGGPVSISYDNPEAWWAAVKSAGYHACLCPLAPAAIDAETHAFQRAAEQAGVVIAGVGAWSNPLSPDDTERQQALECCIHSLALADRVALGAASISPGRAGSPGMAPTPPT